MYNKKLLLNVLNDLNKTKAPVKKRDVDYISPDSMNPILGTPQMKKGGSKKFSKHLGATNRLFKKNPLFKKPNYKSKTYDPQAMYFEDGGEPPYNNLPPTYLTALQNFVYPNVKDDPERTGYNSVNNTINYDSQSPIENMDNKWWMEHELFHDLQNQAGGMSTSGVVGQRPNPYAASDESMQGYYDRRDSDVERTIDSMIAQDPNLQFIPRNKLAEGVGPGFIGAENLQYADPTTLEGEARQYEQYIREGNPSIFPNRKKGGLANYIETELTPEEIEQYRKGGYIVEEVNDSSIPKLDRLKPGGAPCPRGQMKDASGKCVNYNWGSGNIQAADSYAGMYGGYDRSGVKNLKQVSANAKKGKKFSDYVLRGGKSRADVARNLGKNAGQYFGMSGEAIEPVNFTKAGLDKFTADVKSAKKNSEAGEKDYQNYLKSKEKVSKGKMDSSKYAKAFDQKGWSQYDVNTKKGSGFDADYSATAARQNWGDSDEWKKFTGLVSNAATAIPLLGAAGAMGSAGAALLENPVVQGGLTAYGAYDAATNTIPEAAKDFSEGRYWEGAGNVALAGLDLVPGIGLAGKGLKAGTKGLGKFTRFPNIDGKSILDKASTIPNNIGNFITTQTPIKNTYKLLGKDSKFFNPGETPHWRKGYQETWNPDVADLNTLDEFLEANNLNNVPEKIKQQHLEVGQKLQSKVKELNNQADEAIKAGNIEEGVRLRKESMHALKESNDATNAVINDYQASLLPKKSPFKGKIGEGSFGKVYDIEGSNRVVKLGKIPSNENLEELIKRGQGLEGRSNIALTTRSHRLPSGDYATVMNKVDDVSGTGRPTKESYQQLITDVDELQNKGLYLDFQNTDNIVFNPATGKYNLYDLNTTGHYMSRRVTPEMGFSFKADPTFQGIQVPVTEGKSAKDILKAHSLIPDDFRKGGSTDDFIEIDISDLQLGDLIDEDTMNELKRLGYTFEEI